MSLVFSQTASPYKGIIQQLEYKLFGDNGLTRISGNTEMLGRMTSMVNVALDDAFALILQADGTWQFDDSNHTDYPIIYTNLVANQRDYSFTSDENSNLILEIQRVAILKSATDTLYEEIVPVDAQNDRDFITDDATRTGSPLVYDKTANGIFLDPIPDYNATNGLKIYISREASYFATTDTTKKPGFAGLFHMYLVYHVAYNYALDNLSEKAQGYLLRLKEMEQSMKEFYGKRAQDERHVITPKKINYV